MSRSTFKSSTKSILVKEVETQVKTVETYPVLVESQNIGRNCRNIPDFGRKSQNIGRDSLNIPDFGRENQNISRFKTFLKV